MTCAGWVLSLSLSLSLCLLCCAVNESHHQLAIAIAYGPFINL
jgi:hypothetical protein